MQMRSELGRVRGLGAARDGVGHWWRQRVTAVALVPLSLWFVGMVIGLKDADYETVRAFFRAPGHATAMILVVSVALYHALLGVRVVIEDYVHHETGKLAGLVLVQLMTVLLVLFAVVAVFAIAYGG
ncbi:MAG: succinate dehydrogenase membrane anchor subunit [Rhodospirillaceae bacterium]|nr:MAG: succinate dehydrogenase membrane anchor subunit [Rhodospirillaceae bacterium]